MTNKDTPQSNICDCHEAPEQQEYNGHTRYCTAGLAPQSDEQCEHNVSAKHCFRCKRPDLAGPVPQSNNETSVTRCWECGVEEPNHNPKCLYLQPPMRDFTKEEMALLYNNGKPLTPQSNTDWRIRVLEEMNARRVDGKTYIDSEWLLSQLLEAEKKRWENEQSQK